MIKMRTRSIRIPKIGDKFCIALETDVLTSEGWVQLKDIKITHKVASLVNDEKLEYVNPIDIYKFGYSGLMYKVRSEEVELDVTMDHELYVKMDTLNKFELVQAKDVIGKNVLYKTCNLDSGTSFEISLNNKVEETYDYNGEVGCLEVPSHVFMIRQNNKNVWIGNCSRHGHPKIPITGGCGIARFLFQY